MLETDSVAIKRRLHDQAMAEGFSTMRICRPWDVAGVAGDLAEFVEKGHHGQMEWLAERQNWRGNPANLWPEAQSVIMLAENYGPLGDVEEGWDDPEKGLISVYARNKDYHDVVKKRLKRLARWLVAEEECEVKVFVDTAPVPEKPLAQAAGLGWQGKHTNLVSRELGSWFFLGSVFTTLDLPVDNPQKDLCGNCNACQLACPTGAIDGPHRMDARKCISYLTIEHHGPIPLDLRPKLGSWIYGCDKCLAACPWNKFAQDAQEMKYHARSELIAPDLAGLARLDDAGFREKFSGSPIKRIKRGRFVRNVLYAIGNSRRVSLRHVAQELCNDEDPVVADAARWAVERLSK